MATPIPNQDQSAEAFAIAKLVPLSPEAEQAFDDVVEFPDLSEHHRSYIRAERAKSRDNSPVYSSEDTDAEESAVVPERFVRLWTGHYSLSATSFAHSRIPGAGWRVGRGTSRFGEADRGVDILLIRPGRKSEDVSKANALIRFHEKSGVLMLVGLSDIHPITYDNGEDDVTTLRSGESHVLYRRKNLFSFGNLRFKLEYEDFDDTRLAAVTRHRDRFFYEKGIPSPHPSLSMIPRKNHILRGSAILHTTFAMGGFGYVHAAVGTRTGDPLAIKDMWIKSAERAKDPQFMAELDVSQGFKNTPGLLQALECQCEHLHQTYPCGKYPDQFFMTFPLALKDFSKQNWSGVKLDIIAKLLRGPLQGLESLHNAGYMHRDVSPSNILLMSTSPPQAILCDFGKAVKAPKAFETTIGPIPFLAPEVGEPNGYTNKIDIWGVGIVCCWILFPNAISDHITKKKRPDTKFVATMLGMLSEYKAKGKQEKSFAHLIEGMLRWRVENRYTLELPSVFRADIERPHVLLGSEMLIRILPQASEALQHPFLQPPSTPALDADEGSLKHKSRVDKT